MKFHKGELAVQAKAGVASMAERIGGSIKPSIHPVARNFLKELPFVIAASTDKEGNVWASVIRGPRGFMEVPDYNSVRISSAAADEGLIENIRETGRVGLLGIEFETRLRMRLNGRAILRGEWIEIEADEVFSNCQKYIQARNSNDSFSAPGPGRPVETDKLTEDQLAIIESADTFFIASYNEERGADASHRGGRPGFVKAGSDGTIVIPDYSGNNMFQTLGNIESNGKAGLLFIDFGSGTALQLTGRAEILWDEADFADLPGAQRAVKFNVEKIRETVGAFPAGWLFIDYSPANP